MGIAACLVTESPVRLWGLSSRQRLERTLRKLGVTEFVHDVKQGSEHASVILLRGDYVYDERVLKSLIKTRDSLLCVGSSQFPVAAHVISSLAPSIREVLHQSYKGPIPCGVAVYSVDSLTPSYQERLRKVDLPFVWPISREDARALEWRIFSGAYKGITDLITKWLWPIPAFWATRACASMGIRPNHVTLLSVILAVAAGVLFAGGHYALGLVLGWVMTFLDTVDGKLARVTVASSRVGDVLDHGLDLVHPPLWYIAWGLGLSISLDPLISLSQVFWLIVLGYIGGRLAEGIFKWCLGDFGLFCWRPFDSYFRLITARRNPNLILLTISAVMGRPDLGLLAVAFWTVLSTGVLIGRVVFAWYIQRKEGSLRSWFFELDRHEKTSALAIRLFTHQTESPTATAHE